MTQRVPLVALEVEIPFPSNFHKWAESWWRIERPERLWNGWRRLRESRNVDNVAGSCWEVHLREFDGRERAEVEGFGAVFGHYLYRAWPEKYKN